MSGGRELQATATEVCDSWLCPVAVPTASLEGVSTTVRVFLGVVLCVCVCACVLFVLPVRSEPRVEMCTYGCPSYLLNNNHVLIFFVGCKDSMLVDATQLAYNRLLVCAIVLTVSGSDNVPLQKDLGCL